MSEQTKEYVVSCWSTFLNEKWYFTANGPKRWHDRWLPYYDQAKKFSSFDEAESWVQKYSTFIKDEEKLGLRVNFKIEEAI